MTRAQRNTGQGYSDLVKGISFLGSTTLFLKSRRRVHPQDPGLGASWIIPGVGHCALEIKTVAGLEAVFFSPEKNLQLALEHKKKLFTDVSVGFATARVWSNAEKMRLHDRISPGQQLHADSRASFQDFACIRPHQMFVGFRGVVKIENVGFVIARQFAQSADRRTHLRPLESTEESNRDAGGLRNSSERCALLQAQLTQPSTDCPCRSIARRMNQPFPFQGLHNRRSVHAPHFPQK